MPRHPALSPTVTAISGSVYSKLAQKLAVHRGPVYPLHVGDTWMEPPTGCRMEDLRVGEHPGMHRYTAPQGLPALLDAVVDRTSSAERRADDARQRARSPPAPPARSAPSWARW